MNVNTTVEQLVRDDIHEFPESMKGRVRSLVERAFAAGSKESTDATFAETMRESAKREEDEWTAAKAKHESVPIQRTPPRWWTRPS